MKQTDRYLYVGLLTPAHFNRLVDGDLRNLDLKYLKIYKMSVFNVALPKNMVYEASEWPGSTSKDRNGSVRSS